MAQQKFFCATSQVAFTTEAELREHYRSDFHRYNLKRKVAGLPPVTREWFDARRQKLRDAENVAQAMVYVCPLTSKKFQTEATFRAHTQTKKYKQLLQRAQAQHGGNFDPSPVVYAKPTQQDGEGASASETDKPPETSAADTTSHMSTEEAGSAPTSEWDVTRCLFTNVKHPSMEECLVKMHKQFGFYIPYIDRLRDAEGILKYLGAKLTEGRIPLYVSGLDPEAKRFPSLHAVQRHMVRVKDYMGRAGQLGY